MKPQYSCAEEIGWFFRSLFGPSRANPLHIAFPAEETVLNKVLPSFSISAVGDIMDLRGRRLTIGNDVCSFVSGSDMLLANFEGTVTSSPRFLVKQKHERDTLDVLSSFVPASRTVLSLANNHAGDFSSAEFRRSADILRSKGFTVIGTREQPYADLSPSVRVVAASRWSNTPCEEITYITEAADFIRPGAFNILYAHWGHEMKLYPEPENIDLAISMLEQFDAVIGHHPHVPQPIQCRPSSKGTRLAAYSLGNFSTGLPCEHYRHGIIMSFDIGKTANGRISAGQLKWRFTRCHGQELGAAHIELSDGHPFF